MAVRKPLVIIGGVIHGLPDEDTLPIKYGTTAGTSAEGNDPRLSDSREWTASVVSQEEAESGTATTARKWTSQRVRQAITNWASGALGTAAYEDVPTSGNASSSEVVLGSDTRLSDARAPAAHTHTIANVTNLQSTLDGKAATSHTHTIANVTGLQAALDAKTPTYTTTTASANKTLANRERCTVTAAGRTLTLPASPPAGAEVAVSIGGIFVNTVIARNNQNIMGLAENLTIDQPHVTVTFVYIDSARGWRIF